MYDNNAWPETAPIQTFIPERKRPQRVFVGAVAILVAGGFALLAGGLAPVFADANSGVMSLPAAVTITVAVVFAVIAASLGRILLKARKWAPKPARYTSAGMAVVYGLYGLVIAMTEDGSAAVIAGFAFGAALAAVVTAVSMLGNSIDEYFNPPPEPSPFQQQAGQQQPGGPPLGGYDADWTPPAQRQPPGSNHPGGFTR
ncbi:MAG: hypothetical protein ACRD0P_33335 [Stackebrandtia sp.]